MIDLQLWKEYIAGLKVRPLFVTVSGAHLYGFESPDSDVDLRGCHLLPLRQVIGIKQPVSAACIGASRSIWSATTLASISNCW